MIDPKTFSNEHIKYVCSKYGLTYELTQRAIYALGLVETLKKTGLDFVFKSIVSFDQNINNSVILIDMRKYILFEKCDKIYLINEKETN